MATPGAEAPHRHGSGGGNSLGSGEDSSPLSRGTDGDISSSGGAAWDEAPPPPPPPLSHRHGLPTHPAAAGQRVKFMCSYGGRIQPRAHDNQLAYVGGDTKIVAVDRSVRFPQLLARFAALAPAGLGGGDFCFKYQLPGEDLDALISVTDDEDVEHMMVEYDRLQRSPSKPARLRLFLFFSGAGPVRTPSVADAAAAGFSSNLRSPDRQWFVDALNSLPTTPALPTEPVATPVPPPVVAVGNPDFLFGLDEGTGGFSSLPAMHDSALEDNATADAPAAGPIPAAATGSGSSMEDNWVGGAGKPLISDSNQPEIHRGTKREQEKLQVGNGQQETTAAAMAHRQQQERPAKGIEEEIIPSAYPLSPVEYYPPPNGQTPQEKAPGTHQIPFAYLQESVLDDGGGVYPSSMARLDQPIYVIPSPSPQGIYPGPALPALTNGQSRRDCYYAAAATTQSVAPLGALQQSPYLVSPPPQQLSTKTVGGYATRGQAEGNGVAGGGAPPRLLTAYDGIGRPLYVCLRQGTPPAGGSVMSALQAKAATGGEEQQRSTTAQPLPPHLATAVGSSATAATMAQLLNPEVKVAAKPLQAS